MIDPSGIPEIRGNMEFVRHRALRLQRFGTDVATSGADLDSTWQGLAGVYHAPEAGELFAATGPVRTSSAALGDDLSTVGAALLAYADAVDEVKRQLAALRIKADAFVAVHGANNDWHDDDDAVEYNNYLVHAVSVQVAMFAVAQRNCANAINALSCGPQYTADDGDGVAEPGEFGATADQLDAAANQPGALPWGSTQKKDRRFDGDIAAFIGGGWESAKENFWGSLTLVGRDPSGDWSWKAAGESWKNTSTFVLALSPHAQALNRSFGLPGAPKGTLDKTLKDAAKNTVAYDDWGEGDDARAAGKATFNIAGIVGTKGAGAAAKGVGAAAGGSRFGTVAAVGNVLNKTGQALDRVPTVGDAAGAVASKLPTRSSGGPQFDIPEYKDVTPTGGHPDPLNPGSVGDQIARADAADSPQHVEPAEGKDVASEQARQPAVVGAEREPTGSVGKDPGSGGATGDGAGSGGHAGASHDNPSSNLGDSRTESPDPLPSARSEVDAALAAENRVDSPSSRVDREDLLASGADDARGDLSAGQIVPSTDLADYRSTAPVEESLVRRDGALAKRILEPDHDGSFFHTEGGAEFRSEWRPDGSFHIEARDLRLMPGRDRPENPANWFDGQGLHRAHLVADFLGGPGEATSGNVLASSPEYNLKSMRDPEEQMRNSLKQFAETIGVPPDKVRLHVELDGRTGPITHAPDNGEIYRAVQPYEIAKGANVKQIEYLSYRFTPYLPPSGGHPDGLFGPTRVTDIGSDNIVEPW